jgi:hypothetical protein
MTRQLRHDAREETGKGDMLNLVSSFVERSATSIFCLKTRVVLCRR